MLVGTGSEVQLCLGAASRLADAGVAARVVSLPCWEWFEEQDEDYRAEVLPPGVPVLSVEAARRSAGAAMPTTPSGWTASGRRPPGAVAMEKFGFTVEHVVERAQALLGNEQNEQGALT